MNKMVKFEKKQVANQYKLACWLMDEMLAMLTLRRRQGNQNRSRVVSLVFLSGRVSEHTSRTRERLGAVSYTHLTLPTTASV